MAGRRAGLPSYNLPIPCSTQSYVCSLPASSAMRKTSAMYSFVSSSARVWCVPSNAEPDAAKNLASAVKSLRVVNSPGRGDSQSTSNVLCPMPSVPMGRHVRATATCDRGGRPHAAVAGLPLRWSHMAGARLCAT